MKERILNDILGSVQDSTGGGWRVLITDDFTTRVLSSALKMSDILDCNVSVVEDLQKVREPLTQAAIYFITPTAKSVARLCADFEQKPLYPSAHIFFSSKLPGDALQKIKETPALIKVVKTLKEVRHTAAASMHVHARVCWPQPLAERASQNSAQDRTGKARHDALATTCRLGLACFTRLQLQARRWHAVAPGRRMQSRCKSALVAARCTSARSQQRRMCCCLPT